MANDTVWVDGAFVSPAEVSLALDSLALQFGLGLTQDIRAYRRARGELAVFRLVDHVERLLGSARLLQLTPRWSAPQLVLACLETIRRSGSAPGRVRLLLWPSGSVDDLTVAAGNRASVTRAAVQFVAERDAARGGVLHATFSSQVRPHLAAFASQPNVFGNRTALLLAQRAAVQSGFDAALQFDAAGRVLGAAHANVFCITEQRLVTPACSDGAFAGVTRDTVMTLAEEAGHYVDHRAITREQLLLADEVFLTSTRHEVQAVVSIDRISVGQGGVGPVTARLVERMDACTRGTDSNHPEWLSLV